MAAKEKPSSVQSVGRWEDKWKGHGENEGKGFTGKVAFGTDFENKEDSGRNRERKKSIPERTF